MALSFSDNNSFKNSIKRAPEPIKLAWDSNFSFLWIDRGFCGLLRQGSYIIENITKSYKLQ